MSFAASSASRVCSPFSVSSRAIADLMAGIAARMRSSEELRGWTTWASLEPSLDARPLSWSQRFQVARRPKPAPVKRWPDRIG